MCIIGNENADSISAIPATLKTSNMKSANQRKTEFLTELRELLNKHGAEICVEEHSRGFYSTPYLELSMGSIYDHEKDEYIADFVCEDIGTRLDKDYKIQ